uniref:Reverse transcriptase domain-containing protein n=1 Tax=Nicotiana tabacum TaxID=4097 RepID=A0A1S3YM58_TOBAC|nr:uncharacterized protein LOC104109567 [Nicotiana tomentosiformis]XP_016453371.1 PREDICTED: uncharacterized protein LOC107777757 [Nicotiana tabacum]
MEYLTRVLKRMSDLPDFRHHPLCKATKLTHLIFADDSMVFCKGNLASITRVMEALNDFSAVTCLVENLEKSNIFLASMEEDEQARILQYTGFSKETLPIRYLGLPLSSMKWNKIECFQLVEKITAKIKQAYAKNFSYAGRLQVINAILFSIYNFWGAVSILPQSVLKEIDRKCRDYLGGQ